MTDQNNETAYAILRTGEACSGLLSISAALQWVAEQSGIDRRALWQHDRSSSAGSEIRYLITHGQDGEEIADVGLDDVLSAESTPDTVPAQLVLVFEDAGIAARVWAAAAGADGSFVPAHIADAVCDAAQPSSWGRAAAVDLALAARDGTEFAAGQSRAVGGTPDPLGVVVRISAGAGVSITFAARSGPVELILADRNWRVQITDDATVSVSELARCKGVRLALGEAYRLTAGALREYVERMAQDAGVTDLPALAAAAAQRADQHLIRPDGVSISTLAPQVREVAARYGVELVRYGRWGLRAEIGPDAQARAEALAMELTADGLLVSLDFYAQDEDDDETADGFSLGIDLLYCPQDASRNAHWDLVDRLVVRDGEAFEERYERMTLAALRRIEAAPLPGASYADLRELRVAALRSTRQTSRRRRSSASPRPAICPHSRPGMG